MLIDRPPTISKKDGPLPHCRTHADGSINRPRRRSRPTVVFALLMTLLLTGVTSAQADENDGDRVSFNNEVMAVLAKAGCNAGSCHGNLSGKGGLKLSLWGERPEEDFVTLTRDQFSRRVDPVNPDNSLMLRKALGEIAHEGGQRMSRESKEHRILREWIAAGMPADPEGARRVVDLEVTPTEKVLIAPDDSVQLQATITFADGTERDVTDLAVYEASNLLVEISDEGLVETTGPGQATVQVRYLEHRRPVRLTFVPERPDFSWAEPSAANFIDEHVNAQLRTLRMNPSKPADDATFVRRIYMDLVGVPPTAEEARAFVKDDKPDKRERLIDTLLEKPEFNDHWALMWADLLRNEENVLDRKGVQHLHGWIRQAIADEMPMDEFVRQIVTARGSTYADPPTNFYRAVREPNKRAEAVAQVFLGTRMQCAQCHNHPFEQWTQDDYYGFAANFARIKYAILENDRLDSLDKNQFVGEQIVYQAREGEVRDPRDNQPVKPRFLGAGSNVADGEQDRLAALGDWLTSPDNRQFARVMANRIWHRVMGRGIVDPIDDFSTTNPPTNPALLEALTDELIDSGYDLRHMVRLIASSRTYQRSSKPNDTNADDQRHFSRAIVRRYSAEQLLDAMSVATGSPMRFNGFPIEMRAAEMPGVNFVFRNRKPGPGDRFLRMFGKPERLLVCECERTDDPTLEQVFELTGGPAVTGMLQRDDNHLARWLADENRDDAAIIEQLYWSVLSRPPNETERKAMAEHVADRPENRREAFEDIAWALLNAKTFLLRH